MLQQIIIFSLLTFSLCQYKELSKHGSVKVAPETKVYLDISTFPVGELISFDIDMDLFHGLPSSQESYEFFIEQVPATTYYDPHYWDLTVLRKVINKNVSCSSGDCTFKWEEIKAEGKKFIYIYPPTPYDDFYSFWGEKIKITHLGGSSELSAGAIVGIVFGCIFFIVIIILLIACCCCCKNGNTCYTCCYHCCPSCICCCTCCGRSYGPTVPVPVAPVTPVVPPYGAVVQVQPQPVIPPSVPIADYGAVVPPTTYPPTVYPEPVYQPGFVPPSY